MSITACVINYNGERTLAQTLDALKQEGRDGEVLLIDNASDDSSLELLARSYPEVRVLKLDENRGPGAARNLGYREAHHERILFVDNDVVLGAGCIDGLTRALDGDSAVAAAMPRVVHADRPDLIQFDGADCHYLGLQLLHNSETPMDEAESPATKASGSLVTACCLLDRQRLGAAEPFDESFFIYFEDHDAGLRMRIRGHELVSATSSLCFHGLGTPGLSLRERGSYAPERVFFLIRNRWQLVLKNFEARTLWVLSPVLAVYEVVQLAGILLKGWEREYARALRWLWTNRRAIREKRRSVQEVRTLPDRDLLKGGSLPFRAELVRNPLEKFGLRVLNALARAYWLMARRLL